jgi:hypothetical protein
MNLSRKIRVLSLRARLPISLLIVFLQRLPVLRILAGGDTEALTAGAAMALRSSLLGAASLGALDTLAGATSTSNVTLVSSSPSPLAASVGVAIKSVAFGVTGGGASTPDGWEMVSSVPPGLNFSGLTAPGTVSVANPLLSGTPTAAGDYHLDFKAIYQGQETSDFGFEVIVASNGPAFTTQPVNQTDAVGQTAAFTASATSGSTYQWTFNSIPISGATSATLTLGNVQLSAAGNYQVTATNSGGSTLSNIAVLTVTTAPTLPAFTVQPVAETVASPSTVVFSAAASGLPAPTYQWKFNGAAISGATSARLVVNGATAANAGSYTCVATNSVGSAPSAAATLSIASTANPGRLGNLSVLSTFANGQLLTVGFITGGAGTSGTQSLLVRADGPTLASFGLSSTMVDPTFSVIPLGSTTTVASNNNWGAPASNASVVMAADSATGAFALIANSLDAAEVVSLSPAGYSVQVTGTGPGQALTELYDTTSPAAYTLTVPRLVNVSCNTTLPIGGTLTAGFTIGGNTAKTVLIRASGPTLAGFGLTGTMVDPQIVLQPLGSSAILASNAGWGGDPQIAAAAAAVGAFAFSGPASKDSAVLITLAPGGYTAVANSASGGGGTTVVEVYEIP